MWLIRFDVIKKNVQHKIIAIPSDFSISTPIELAYITHKLFIQHWTLNIFKVYLCIKSVTYPWKRGKELYPPKMSLKLKQITNNSKNIYSVIIYYILYFILKTVYFCIQ